MFPACGVLVVEALLGCLMNTPITFHRFCPQCGRALTQGHGEKSIHCGACGFLLYFNVASAVGAIIPDEAGRILLLRRALEPAKGKLGVPGGFVDPGESMEEALAREVHEEVNLRLDATRYLLSCPNQYLCAGITYATLDLYYVCTVESLQSLRPLEEVDAVSWVDPREIDYDQIAFPSLRQALKAYTNRCGSVFSQR